jgi:hypothetical protein
VARSTSGQGVTISGCGMGKGALSGAPFRLPIREPQRPSPPSHIPAPHPIAPRRVRGAGGILARNRGIARAARRPSFLCTDPPSRQIRHFPIPQHPPYQWLSECAPGYCPPGICPLSFWLGRSQPGGGAGSPRERGKAGKDAARRKPEPRAPRKIPDSLTRRAEILSPNGGSCQRRDASQRERAEPREARGIEGI